MSEDNKRAKWYFGYIHAGVLADGSLFYRSHLSLGTLRNCALFGGHGFCLHTFRKCFVVHTCTTSWTYTGGEVGMYILQAWDFYLDWLFFMFSLFGLWLESKCFFPGLKPSQLSPSVVLSQHEFFSGLLIYSARLIPETFHLHALSVMWDAAKLVMPGGGAPDAWGLMIKTILSFTTVFFCL